MIKCNPENERIKRKYFEYQKEANKKSIDTIDNIRKAISRYEINTNYQGFETFNRQKAIAFKKRLAEQKASSGGDCLSKSTVLSTTRHMKDFFKWLSRENGYKRLDVRDIEYFNLSDNEIRMAQGKKRRIAPSIEQIKAVIRSMPARNDIEMRNKALIAFTLLTGIRDNAIASLRLKHIKVEEGLVEQLPPDVKTKNGKTIYTYFFPVGDEIKAIVIDWINYLYKIKLFNPDDPVFPRTKLKLDENNAFKADGIEPIFWRSANQIRDIFKESFMKAGLEYYNPHSFRSTLARLGEECCKTPEEFKAWSQNLGHENPLTTFTSYGYVDEYRQGQLIHSLGKINKEDNSNKVILEKLDQILKNKS